MSKAFWWRAPGSASMIAFAGSSVAATVLSRDGIGRSAGFAPVLERSLGNLGTVPFPLLTIAACVNGAAIREESRWLSGYLSGRSPRSLLLGQVGRFAARCASVVGVAFALLVAVGWAGRGSVVGPSGSLTAACEHLGAAALLVGASVVLWSAIGWHAQSRSVAILLAVAVAGLDASWSHLLHSFRMVNLVWAYSPLGSSSLVLRDARPEVLGHRLGITWMYVIAVCVAVLAAISVRVPRTPGYPATISQRRWVIVTAVSALGIGLAVPHWLQSGLPWYQSPTWRLDSAIGRAADDVVGDFIAAVQRGDDLSANGAVASGTAEQVLGVFRRPLLTAGPPEEIRVISGGGTPGGIAVYWESGFAANFCLTRSTGRWLIYGVGGAPCRAP